MPSARELNGRFDLDAAAAKAEANAQPFSFTFKGTNYDVPPTAQWPVEVMDLLGEGELTRALQIMLGEENYAKLAEAGVTVGALNVLFEEIAKASGFDGLPKSPSPVPRRVSTRT
jgi:hypothetical protein